MANFQAYIFDLDGVLVDTAQFHYQSWKHLADELEIPFTPADNEKLKGVSREDSLNLLLGSHLANREEKKLWAEKKNEWYLRYVNDMEPQDVLPGARELLETLRKRNIKIALGSSSKNAKLVLKLTQLSSYFDVVVDGNMIQRAKPDPELFLLAAGRLGVPPIDCVVFEDAAAGIAAAKSAGMFAVAVGDDPGLAHADMRLASLEDIRWHDLPFNL